jgi:hypothetical protein
MSVVDTSEKRLAKAGRSMVGELGGRTSVGHGAGRAPPQLVRLIFSTLAPVLHLLNGVAPSSQHGPH